LAVVLSESAALLASRPLRATLLLIDPLGAYTADRAAALSGVPISTIHWWARERILLPSVSATKRRLWSFGDLMGLRTIYWLRRRKTTEAGMDIPATSMNAVRAALASLATLNVPLWRGNRPTVLVGGDGRLYPETRDGVLTADGQVAAGDLLDLIAPFTTHEGLRGPDLYQPRAHLRIVPGKLSGSPHIIGTRVETRALAALCNDGYDARQVADLYPYLLAEQIDEALDLERQLEQNLSVPVAA
jgi:uncharacterized protein (DUF433 family)